MDCSAHVSGALWQENQQNSLESNRYALPKQIIAVMPFWFDREKV